MAGSRPIFNQDLWDFKPHVLPSPLKLKIKGVVLLLNSGHLFRVSATKTHAKCGHKKQAMNHQTVLCVPSVGASHLILAELTNSWVIGIYLNVLIDNYRLQRTPLAIHKACYLCGRNIKKKPIQTDFMSTSTSFSVIADPLNFLSLRHADT